MTRWKVTIAAWPHSTGEGRDTDQRAAGERSKDYVVRAMDFQGAVVLAEAIAMGVRANPAVWRAPIEAIVKQPHEGSDQ